jgi:hypothetical protein
MFMKLMKQKNIKICFLLCEYITPTSFVYIYILLPSKRPTETFGPRMHRLP